MKKGAIELSIGTIVIVVLAMSMLILGMVLIRGIFSGVTDITDMSLGQVTNEITKSWGEDKGLMLYPSSGEMDIKSGSTKAFAVGMRNILTGGASIEKKFRYEIIVEDVGDCRGIVSDREILDLIVTGRELSPTSLSPGGQPAVRKVTLTIPEGFPLCAFTYKVQAFDGNAPYLVEYMDIRVRR